jgi:preprotein translocase subunit SecE
VARQRQRARDRKQQQREQSNPGPRPTEPHRDNVPGELDHASGFEEEFEAGIVSGAEGDPADDGEGADIDDAALEKQAVAAHPSPVAPTRGGNRFVNFLRASWAELQRVQWPDRRQVGQATGVVLGFVIIAGLYLGLADWLAQRVVNFIL